MSGEAIKMAMKCTGWGLHVSTGMGERFKLESNKEQKKTDYK
jgi:hypothetical protein